MAVVYFVMSSSAPSDPIPMHSRNVCSRAALVAGVFALILAAPLGAQGKGYTLSDILGLLRRHVLGHLRQWHCEPHSHRGRQSQ